MYRVRVSGVQKKSASRSSVFLNNRIRLLTSRHRRQAALYGKQLRPPNDDAEINSESIADDSNEEDASEQESEHSYSEQPRSPDGAHIPVSDLDQPSIDDLRQALSTPGLSEASSEDWLLLALMMMGRLNCSLENGQMLLDMMRLISGHDKLPASQYLFWQKVRQEASVEMEAHFVCPACKYYLGGAPYPSPSIVFECERCGQQNAMRAGNTTNHWFLYIPLRNVLPNFLMKMGYRLDYRLRRGGDDNSYRDVYDGLLYRALPLQHTGLQSDSPIVDVSLAVNVDGTPAFRRMALGSLVPLQVTVLELNGFAAH